MFWKILIGILFFYFLLRFLFRFVLPIVRVTRHTQAKMNEIRKKMEEMEAQQTKVNTSKHNKTTEGEYIDYEEVK